MTDPSSEERPDEPAKGPDGPGSWTPGERGVRPPVQDDDGTLRCGYCSAPLAEDQTYCLECGSPTPLAPGLRRGRAAAAIAVGLIVLGAGAGVLAFVMASSDDDSGGTTTTALTIPPATDVGEPVPGTDLPPDTSLEPLPTAPTDTDPEPFPTDTTGTGTVSSPEPTETFETVTGTESIPPETTTEPDVPTTPAGGDDWPVGRTAWTAILSSVRVEADARAAADELQAQGTDAGVLVSDDHAGLRPGYYVVFSGVYDDRQSAIDQAARLAADFPGAYARQITG